MVLTLGTRLGVYEVQGLLGTGGMSEVYRARDTRLNRDVAIKVMADWLATDSEWLARFEQEALVLASLNHPYIAQVYGLEEFACTTAPPLRALVMELVEGPTLANRIAQGPIPLPEALSIAQQMLEALETAHDRGIIHRDLKPANIKLTATGMVKVLDFGLAKLIGRVDTAAGPANTTHSPAFGTPPTRSGVVLGTAAYMSPEQARGHAVDRRADVWAFGVVLYEMLTGHRLFQGETMSDTIAAVLRQDVDWGRLPASTPATLRQVLKRCLLRNPKGRFRDGADLRMAFAGPLDELDSRESRDSARLRAPLGWISASVITLGVVIGLLTWRTAPDRPAAPPVVRFAIEPPPQVTHIAQVAADAGGRFVVYEAQVGGESHLFMRRFDELESHRIPGTEGGRGPFLSPDGAWVGFSRARSIQKVPAAGGDAIVVASVQGGPGATWTPDGRIVFSRAWLSGLSVVSDEGGAATVLTEPDPAKQEIGHWWPSSLPGGPVLFTIAVAGTGLNEARVALLDPATGSYRELFPGARAQWLPSGHIVFYRAGKYYAVPFRLSSLSVTGEPFPVVDDARELDPAGDWSATLTTTSSGALVYLAGAYVPPSRLTWIAPDGSASPLGFAARPYVSVKLSPDGRSAATASLEAGRLLLRVFDLERGVEEVPRIDGMNWNPVWLPDGRLSFTSMRKGDFDVYLTDVAGSGPEQPVLVGPEDADPIAWTRDGRIVFQGSEPDGTYPLKLFDPRRPSDVLRLTPQHVENGGSLSPNERWLAFQTAASGRSIVYVRALGNNLSAVALAGDQGEFPIFLRDGKAIAMVKGDRLVVRTWREDGETFEIGPERVITQLSFGSGWTYGAPYDAAPGGKFLALIRTEAAPPPRVRVVLGWDHHVAQLERGHSRP